MPRPKKEATILKEQQEQQNKLIAEKIAERTDICRLSELSTQTIEYYDCSKLSIYITKSCQPAVDFLINLNRVNIEYIKVKSGEYINIKIENSWKNVLLAVLMIAYYTHESRGSFEKELIANKITGKELRFSNGISLDDTTGSPIYAEEFIKGYYIYSTYSDKIIVKAISKLSSLLKIDIEKSLLKLEPREEKEHRYQPERSHMPIPMQTEWGHLFLSGNMNGACWAAAMHLKEALELKSCTTIVLLHPELNPMEAYKCIEKVCSKYNITGKYLIAYPLINGHLDVLREELPALNKELFNKYSFSDISAEQYETLEPIISKPQLSIEKLEKLQDMGINFLIFNARRYYDTLYQGNLPN